MQIRTVRDGWLRQIRDDNGRWITYHFDNRAFSERLVQTMSVRDVISHGRKFAVSEKRDEAIQKGSEGMDSKIPEKPGNALFVDNEVKADPKVLKRVEEHQRDLIKRGK